MARAPLTFRQRDVTAAIKAVERSGYKGAFSVRIGQDGSIKIELAPAAPNDATPVLENPWDEVLKHEGN